MAGVDAEQLWAWHGQLATALAQMRSEGIKGVIKLKNKPPTPEMMRAVAMVEQVRDEMRTALSRHKMGHDSHHDTND